MRHIAEDLYAIDFDFSVLGYEGVPSDQLNVYVMGGVIVDAGVRYLADQIVAQVQGKNVTAHALTHGHMDHQGSTHAICDALDIPLYCSAVEADAIESGEIIALVPDLPANREDIEKMAGPGHPVARRLREGDEVGGFVVVESPGHSPGHISFWRESDRVLIVGDALGNRHYPSMEVGLNEPHVEHSVDPARNRESIRKLAALEPLVCCFGHGPVLTNPDELHSFVETLRESVPASS